ncbi:hypothetical protein L2E82_17952 [Cichorium intybus]|uniref:Uncharacterized protein n=1 Tax=Cichorium intybus TaxID=13427 RepID=A0ACB9F958_CICIN|nr:hypothetical protein L2E82_17952 [Cichorium intybus]
MAEEGMVETTLSGDNDKLEREAPQLVTVLKDIKGGLDDLRAKVQVLTSKKSISTFTILSIKTHNSSVYPTSDGMSYLEAKHLLLLNYCQSLVYYLLRKAKGLPIQGHPLVHSLLETRLFLEKIRPIDKKLQYQIKKLATLTGNQMEDVGPDDKTKPVASDDALKLRPNPDMLINKDAPEDGDGLYQPPKNAPASMKSSKEERNVSRKQKQFFREALQSEYARELINDLEGRPEEVREVIGSEEREVTRYKAKMEELARREEELFTRAPLTSMEKKQLKHMRKSRNGYLMYFLQAASLPLEEGVDGQTASPDAGKRKLKRHKRRR